MIKSSNYFTDIRIVGSSKCFVSAQRENSCAKFDEFGLEFGNGCLQTLLATVTL